MDTYDSTFVALNDTYFRRLYIPILLTTLVFLGCVAILRGTEGIATNDISRAFQFGGNWLFRAPK
jgi:hypothetical protein